MKSERYNVKLSDIAYFNPTEKLSKGTLAKKVAMDKLQPFCREIPSYEWKAFSGGTKFRNGDTIMARITPCLENGKVAKVSILDENEIGFGSTEYIVFRAKENVDPDFLYYLICSPIVREPAIKSMVGSSGRQRVQTSVVENLMISVPSLEEQRKIGSLLKALDDKIALNNQINNNLEQQATALMTNYCASMSFTTELGQIMRFENGYAFQSKSYLPIGKYRIITIKNVQDGKIDSQGAAFIDDVPQNMKAGCFLSIGDSLLSLTGNVGRVGIVYENNLLLNQRVAKFVPNRNELLPWLYYYFRLPSMKTSLETIAKGTAQQNLSPVETLKLEVSFEEESARELSKVLQPMYDAEVQNSIESLRLSQLRDSLLPRLISGELDVSDIEL